ncbi:MAG TPA: NAD(P)/FAD-dependent oxidoreductase [Candidatus Acidoferrales bacterium]|nr:NAD(P)/FAD-dependent oxidoreductase [Candidatus Acidoferrales bacterium]
MRACDVLIVGGGPAGSSCAWKLRRAGLDVVVWDRRTFPRDKICAGWITPQILTELSLDPGAYAARGLTIQPIRGFRIARLGDREARIRYERPVSYGIRRCEFDNYLLRRSGADLRLGQPVHTLRRLQDEWLLNDALSAKVLVGAGGHFCPVAQVLGARLGAGEPIVAAQEAEFELTPKQQQACRVEPDVPEIFFTRDLKGYGWVFRKGAYINIGLGRQDTHQLGEHVAQFVAFLEQRGRIPAGLPAKFHGHPYLLYGETQRPLMGEAALLIGDAAGLAYPRSGEGIRPAIESGLLAAQTILEADGQYDREHLAVYAQRVVARFGPRRAGMGVTDVVPQWVAGAIAGRLFGAAWFAQRVVVESWFLHAQQPALAESGPGAPAARRAPVRREYRPAAGSRIG